MLTMYKNAVIMLTSWEQTIGNPPLHLPLLLLTAAACLCGSHGSLNSKLSYVFTVVSELLDSPLDMKFDLSDKLSHNELMNLKELGL